MERLVDILARLIIAVIKAKVYIFAFLLIMFLAAELRQCEGVAPSQVCETDTLGITDSPFFLLCF